MSLDSDRSSSSADDLSPTPVANDEATTDKKMPMVHEIDTTA